MAFDLEDNYNQVTLDIIIQAASTALLISPNTTYTLLTGAAFVTLMYQIRTRPSFRSDTKTTTITNVARFENKSLNPFVGVPYILNINY